MPLSSASTQEPAGSSRWSALAFFAALPSKVPVSSTTCGMPPIAAALAISTAGAAARPWPRSASAIACSSSTLFVLDEAR